MANTKVTQHVIADDAITTAMITDANVTPAKLHGTLDLSSKTITLPAVAIPSASTATTQSQSDGSTKVATTAYVDTAVSNLVDSSPSSLNTLNELAAALNDDASFSTTVTNSIATKLPLAGGTMTGNIAHASDFTLDIGGDLTLDADGGDIKISDGGTQYGLIANSSSDLIVQSTVSDKDIIFRGNDGGSTVVAMTLDMSEAGHATFNDGAVFGGTGALRIPQGTTGQRPTAATGQIRWNTTDGALEVYSGSAWTAVGTGSSNKILDTFTGDGSTAAFTLTVTPANEDALMVFIDGVYQEKGDYSLSSAVLTLDTAPASGEKVAVHTTTASVHDGTSAVNQQFTGDGSTTAFTLSSDPDSENNTQIYINGVYQQKTDYTVSGTTLTFDTAPTNGDIIEVNSFAVTTLGNSDTITEGVSNLYHTSARAISAISAGTLTALSVSSSADQVADFYSTDAEGYIRIRDNNDSLYVSSDTAIGSFGGNVGSHANNLNIDLTNGKVGIGTISPAQTLHVDGTGHITGIVGVNKSVNSSVGLSVGSDASTSTSYGLEVCNASSNTRFLVDGSGSQRFYGSDNAETARFTDGKLGIGTTSPEQNLHIACDSGDEGILLKGTGNTSHALTMDANRSSGGGALGEIRGLWDGTEVARMVFRGGDDTTNKDDGLITFATSTADNIAERMRINSTGEVGIGTTAVAHYTGYRALDIGTALSLFSNSGGTNVSTLTNNGYLNSGASNWIYKVTDEATMYSQVHGDHRWSTAASGSAGAAITWSEKMRINANGIILGATTTTPNYPGTFTSLRTGSSATTTQNTWGFNATAGGSNLDFGYKAAGAGSYAYGVLNAAETAWMSRLDFAGAIHLTNTTVQSQSDRRLKKDIVDANSQWDDIKALQFKNFKWKDEAKGTDTYLGLIADEVESVSPGLVGIEAISAETMPEDGVDPEYKNVKYSIVWMKAVKALQEAMTKIETLETELETAKARITTLEG